jgi:hypothetical protein
LLGQYERLTTSDIIPVITEGNPELSNLVCCIAMCGDFAQWWGSVTAASLALGGFLNFLGVERLTDLRTRPRNELSQAALICLRAVPERRVTECVDIIRRVIRVTEYLNGDWSTVRTLGDAKVRRLVRGITQEPVAALIIMQALGADDVRPLPDGGAASCAMKIGIVERWVPEYVSGGHRAVREEALKVLQRLSPTTYLALHWWGGGGSVGSSVGCPESCSCCGAATYCDALCRGLV